MQISEKNSKYFFLILIIINFKELTILGVIVMYVLLFYVEIHSKTLVFWTS